MTKKQRPPTCIRLKPAVETRLRNIAAANDTSVSALIARAVLEYLAKLPR